MRLTQQCDYGIRVVLFLAARDGSRVSTEEIASAYGISHNHLQKVVRGLAQSGLVRTYRGQGGGIELAQQPSAISIGAVVRALESEDRLVECFDASTDACAVSPACHVKAALRKAQRAFLDELDAVSLADAVAGRRAARLRTLTEPSS